VRGQKKQVFGSEGMVAGIGCQTLAFVGWHFPFFYSTMLSLCLFFGLRTTVGGMAS